VRQVRGKSRLNHHLGGLLLGKVSKRRLEMSAVTLVACLFSKTHFNIWKLWATLGTVMGLGSYQDNQLGTMFWNRTECISA
jgi:hypothetical protein